MKTVDLSDICFTDIDVEDVDSFRLYHVAFVNRLRKEFGSLNQEVVDIIDNIEDADDYSEFSLQVDKLDLYCRLNHIHLILCF